MLFTSTDAEAPTLEILTQTLWMGARHWYFKQKSSQVFQCSTRNERQPRGRKKVMTQGKEEKAAVVETVPFEEF